MDKIILSTAGQGTGNVEQTGYYICSRCADEKRIVVPIPLKKGDATPKCDKHPDAAYVLAIGRS